MKRLTKRADIGNKVFFSEDACNLCGYAEQNRSTFCENVGCAGTKDRSCPYLMVIDRLAAYEDTGLEPEEIKELCTDEVAEVARTFRRMIQSGEIAHLQELLNAEQDGRLVVLPCKVGDTVYFVFDGKVHEVRVQGIPIGANNQVLLNFGGYPVQYAWGSEVGKTVFLAREEAERALAKQ